MKELETEIYFMCLPFMINNEGDNINSLKAIIKLGIDHSKMGVNKPIEDIINKLKKKLSERFELGSNMEDKIIQRFFIDIINY